MGPFATALSLIASGDPDLMAIIGLSLRVTLAAVSLGCVLGLPLGAALALARFPGKGALIVGFMRWWGSRPVVTGLRDPYAAILVKLSRHPHVKAEAGQDSIDWLVSAEGQAAIGS